jgi:alkylresorcinol/alkylpyrone synthase
LPPAPRVSAVGRVLPPHRLDQEQILASLRGLWAEKHYNPARLDDLHRAVRVKARHLALPLERYPGLDSFAKQNDAWIEVAQDLGARAVRDALERAGLAAGDVDHFLSVTVTGIATPSLEALISPGLGMRPDVKRLPIFGLGCVAGAAGLSRAADLLKGDPGGVAVLLSVELCSLTMQREDLSITNIIASGLFGDGAAAVVLVGGERAHGRGSGPRIVATRSVLYPATQRVMGWDVVDTGFKVVLSADVPQVIRARLGGDVQRFLADHGLDLGRVRHFIAHTGGPKIIEAVEESLALAPGALARSWRSLEEVGNLSSASVMFVLGDFLDSDEARPGDLGLLVAMGPGFCAELVLLQW